MKRTRILAGVAALALAVTGSTAAAPTAKPKLVGAVSDPFNISLMQDGKKVTSLKAGTYTVVVQDTASDHNLHLKGPGVDKATSVSGKGTTRWTVKLRKGTYTYVCDPHASFMRGAFVVR